MNQKLEQFKEEISKKRIAIIGVGVSNLPLLDYLYEKKANVTVFDNTKGQIIDFNKWLEKYPNRKKSGGRLNKWASAKHCYSVEKCMELINDGFILLDSDVLLKRDISNLIDDKTIFTGEVITQPNSSVKRVLPFICYINVKMCKEKGVHYFNDNYMHGLWKNGVVFFTFRTAESHLFQTDQAGEVDGT